ncbi:DUF3291 domain-containing protein [Catellatospora citrea]|uniref:DUF3291 domain-containing protein n=1 Tax=Catellatospora citrea TaxID=53366 RepID=A0A8J3KLL8_9ACTN|nr:DUF3291 domain-containing protein [Catellatospora citrea]RKE10804.1 uncharacterized protein DUF3291 [Catellatospora citrea]GIG00959.1 hypothetical protein Cci01nite_60520 [Catellatospora citrea]
MNLAQLNVGRLVAPLDAPEMAAFVALLEPINALADDAPGFVWRFTASDTDSAVAYRHDSGDDLLINMSVWRTRQDLWNYVYRTRHLAVLQRRREWFARTVEVHSVMWWVPDGHLPTAAEGMARLARLAEHGPGPDAFTFKDFHEPSGTPA